MTASRLFSGIACAAVVLGAQASALAAPWAVRTPPSDRVPFKGVASMDDVGKPGAMLYPAAGAAGLIAAIVTHAVIASSVRDHEKSEIEKAADKILEPFDASLATFTLRDLVLGASALSRHGEPRWLASNEKAEAWVVSSKPVFSMTQDRAALILENDVTLTPPSGQPVYANRVRVISSVHLYENLAGFWGEDQARALKAESVRLLAASVDIALDDAIVPRPAASPGAQRTVRYPEGGKLVFERAEIIKEACDRMLLRNLRGWLVSVPRNGPPASSCAEAAQ
ncbi:hypothetical protein [Telluria aromaticivorans]|uniref:Uncharacterized protein n=1 Tax=Telluria aromaticivorans TaxID=2725995 RepID=A0A7Y2JVA8_9BURK|nr:hypothetical protein [Telluria aromaticivorans]NNG21697.1 hypothetical protein [Telluria aromaticivorans]